MEISLRTIKYSGLVFQSLIFQRKAKNINFDRKSKGNFEILKVLKRPAVIGWKQAENVLANVHDTN